MLIMICKVPMNRSGWLFNDLEKAAWEQQLASSRNSDDRIDACLTRRAASTLETGRATEADSILRWCLRDEMADLARAKVATGEYATESEVIREGLRTLLARDHAVEGWLREQWLQPMKP